jgi:uroporphyrinogen decarboxylase
MTGRERVKATLTFSSPDRIPRDLWVLPYISLFRKTELEEIRIKFPADIDSPGSITPETEAIQRLATPGIYTDEWGSIWQVGEPGIIGEVKKPVLEDWSNLKSFRPPPVPDAQSEFNEVNRFCERSDKFILSAAAARLFERLQFLRGPENLYMDLAYDTREIRTLIDIVHGYYLENITAWANSSVDAVFLVDDWGSNKTLLVHPDMWRSIFKPLYREYCDIIHKRGKFVFFHSDGNIAAIIPDLIEIGVDALNAQLFCMDIEELGRKFKGRITFWGEIDRQYILPFGTLTDVRNAVQRVRCALGDDRGGVIGQCEWGKDVPKEHVEAVFESWL